MKYSKTDIAGVWVMEPDVYKDTRGYFYEAWKQAEFDEYIGYHVDFIQDNESMSTKGVLRGLHYQKGTFSQAKLVRVLRGKVLDVAIDLRRNSPTIGKYVAVELSETNRHQLFIPRGFAHGFLVLSDEAVFTYKVDNVYSPNSEAILRWNDKTVGIEWGINPNEVILSEKDLNKSCSWENADLFG